EGEPVEESDKFYEKERVTQSDVVPAEEGLNRFVWNMRYPGATDLEGTQILWAGSTDGPEAIPGRYSVRLVVDGEPIMEQPFEIVKDPRIETTQDDFRAQFDLHKTIISKLDTTHKAINRIREIRAEIDELLEENPTGETRARAETIKDRLAEIEGALVQTKAEAFQDVLNYPIKLNNKLAALANTVATGDNRPTKQQYAVFEELAAKVDAKLEALDPILERELPELQ
ncbi:MAG: glycosyl hydrolase, partial [Balneolaceae bacterium]|nr:glycosyl hydrolase [Balneolaceae bacterium]